MKTAVMCALVAVPGVAAADNPRCHPYATEPARVPWTGKLRVEAGGVAAVVGDDFERAGGVGLGISRLVDPGLIFSFDVGVHVSAVAGHDVRALLVDLDLRWFPVKLQQAKGIDECGYGRKNRRWSEHTDGAGYLLVRVGYGAFDTEGAEAVDAFDVSPGVGYEVNVSMRTSLFVQAAYRIAAGTWDGPLIEAGLRF